MQAAFCIVHILGKSLATRGEYTSALDKCAYIITGRRDSAVADPTGRLPEETLSAEALRLTFAAMGMSPQELVALSGAHTVDAQAL